MRACRVTAARLLSNGARRGVCESPVAQRGLASVTEIEKWGRGEVESLGVDTVAGVLHIISRSEKRNASMMVVAQLAEHVTACLRSGARYSSPNALVSIVKALANAEVYTPTTFAETAKHVTAALGPGSITSALHSSEVAGVAQAYATCLYYSAPLLSALELHLTDTAAMTAMSPDDTLSLLSSMATLSHPIETNSVLLAAIHVMSTWDDLSAEQAAQRASLLSWSTGVLVQLRNSEGAADDNTVELMANVATLTLDRGDDALCTLNLEQAAQLLHGMANVVFSEQRFDDATRHKNASHCALLCESVAGHIESMLEAAFPQGEAVGAEAVSHVQSVVGSLHTLLKNSSALDMDLAACTQAVSQLCRCIGSNFDAFFSNAPRGTVATLHSVLHSLPSDRQHEVQELFHQVCLALCHEGTAHCIDKLSLVDLGVLAYDLVQLGQADQAVLGLIFRQSLRDDVADDVPASAISCLSYAAISTGHHPSNYFTSLMSLVQRKQVGQPQALQECLEVLEYYDPTGSVRAALDAEADGDVSPAPSLPAAKLHRRTVPLGFPLQSQLGAWPHVTPQQLADPRTKIMLQGRDGWLSELPLKMRDPVAPAVAKRQVDHCLNYNVASRGCARPSSITIF